MAGAASTSRHGEVRGTGRGRRAGQRYGMRLLQEPGSSDADQSKIADGAVAENGARPAWRSPLRGSEQGDARLERNGECRL